MGAPLHDWYLAEWLKACQKKQADVVRELGWNKAKISLMVNGKQAYTREEVNELAAYLNIDPHELLMHPDKAFRIRRLQDDLIHLAHEREEGEAEKPLKKVSAN